MRFGGESITGDVGHPDLHEAVSPLAHPTTVSRNSISYCHAAMLHVTSGQVEAYVSLPHSQQLPQHLHEQDASLVVGALQVVGEVCEADFVLRVSE